MADRTKFQDIRAALNTAITTQLTTDGVSCVFGKHPPLGNVTREDRAYLGEIRFSQEPHTFGSYVEDIEVDVVVACPDFGGAETDMEDAEARCETIFDSILETLRTDITIGSTVFNVELGETESKVGVIDDQGPWGMIEATLLIETHI